MIRSFSILTLFVLSIGIAYGQLDKKLFHSDFEQDAFSSEDPFQILLAADPDVDANKYNEYIAEFEDHIDKLSKKVAGYDKERLIERVFYYTHRKKLSWYDEEVTFSDLFKSGKYDCLTGTAYYSKVLDHLGIPYRILEFDFHVFLVASADGKAILIEPTDPLFGLVTDNNEIIKRIAQHVNNKEEGAMGIYNRISLDELAGLQYYNKSVLSYNEGAYEEAGEYLQKAKFLYPSKRIKEMHLFFNSQARLVGSN